jgi:microcystin-dependent protein
MVVDDGVPSSSLQQGGVVSDPFIGQLLTLPFSWAPYGWAQCNGQTISAQQNQAMLALLGNTYGGDGNTTVGLPDLRGRTVVGSGTDTSGHSWPFAQAGGTPQQALTVANMPQHTHAATFTPTSSSTSVSATVTGTLNAAVSLSATYNAVSASGSTATPASGNSLGIASPSSVKIYTSNTGTAVPIGTVTANGNVTGTLSVPASGSYPSTWGGAVSVGNTGSGAPFSIMPPYVTLNVCIATSGIFPTRD